MKQHDQYLNILDKVTSLKKWMITCCCLTQDMLHAMRSFTFILISRNVSNSNDSIFSEREHEGQQHIRSSFLTGSFSRNSRNQWFSSKVWNFLRGNGPRYSYQNFTTYALCGSPYNAIEILTLTLRILGNWGKLFWGGRPRGPLGQKCMGWP